MLERISDIIDTLSLLIRIVLEDGTVSDWSKWLTFPSPGYGEIMRHGPFRIADVKRIEIDTVEVKKLGKRIPEKKIDHSEELKQVLQASNIEYEQEGNIIRICLM